MKKSTLLLTLAAGLAFSPLAGAEQLTKAHYQAAEKAAEADAKAGLSGCDALADNAKDVCVAEVKGKERIAKAELEARYQPTAKNLDAVPVAKAEAAYKASMERCDDRAGNDKDVCVKEAKAARVHALSSAERQSTTSRADAAAREARTEARQDAASDNAEADYAVAKEKCDGLAGEPKERCISDAKALFGQR